MNHPLTIVIFLLEFSCWTRRWNSFVFLFSFILGDICNFSYIKNFSIFIFFKFFNFFLSLFSHFGFHLRNYFSYSNCLEFNMTGCFFFLSFRNLIILVLTFIHVILTGSPLSSLLYEPY